MAIGIIGALEAIEGNARPDDNSVVPPIDRLASLPQVLIMQMAQKGQTPKSMVAPVLAKKTENAQATAQIKAVAQQMAQQQQMGGPPPSTVIEKVIAQNAAQEAAPPMNRSNVGVASAPMRPDMFAKAGGGIVAFGNGGLLEEYSKLPRSEYTDPVFEGQPLSKFFRRFQRPEGISSLLGEEKRVTPDGKTVSFGDFMKIAEQRDIDTVNDSSGFEGAVAETTEKDRRPATVKFSDLKEPIDLKNYDEIANKREDIPGRRRGDGLTDVTGTSDQAAVDANAKEEEILGRPEGEIEGLGDVVVDMADKTQAIMDSIGLQKPEAFKPDDFSVENTRRLFTDAGVNLDLLSDQAGKLGDERLKLKEDKKEALAFFGLEAGLNILAGKDPNALVNIGAGAGKAIAPLRKELTRLKDQHNSLRKEENQLARMQSQQDMGIAKFSQERLNDVRKSYDANLRNYNTTRAQIANGVLTNNSALQRVKISAGATVKSAEMRAKGAAATALGTKRRSDTMNTIKALESLKNTREYRDIERKIRKAKTGEDRNAARKELIDLENKRLEQLGLPPLQDPITSDRYEGYKVTEIKN